MTAGRGSRFPGAVRGQGPGTVTTAPASPVTLPALVGGPPPHKQEMRNDRRPFGNGEDDQGVPPAQVDDQQEKCGHEDRMVVVMLVSWAGLMSYPGSMAGHSGWPGWT